MVSVWARVCCGAAVLALVAAGAAPDQDFEFDDAPEGARRPHRYVYDPQSPLCGALRCSKREVCVVRDARTALCATKKDILKRGDVIVAAGGGAGAERVPGAAVGVDDSGDAEEDDDVFYDADGEEPPAPPAPERCVGCGSAGAQFLCGSDNRTYSSACRLRLHNCVRRPATPVTRACRGFCPCRPRAHNDVLPPRAAAPCRLERMADRLLDWFSVLMEGAREAPPPARGFPAACKGEVRWMFAHLDADRDGRLSAAELYALRHDERERCLRPFLASCGGGGASRGVSRAAWCGCLRRAARPCAALARAARARGAPGGWAPACDARGFYRPRQCHAALAVCWCVDAHGQELPRSRTKGEPPCPARRPVLAPAPAPTADSDDEDAPASGDGELRY